MPEELYTSRDFCELAEKEGRAPKNGHKQPGADVERFRELYRKQKQGAK